MTQSTHEIFAREETIVAGSDRSFGIIMASALAILTLLNGWHGGRLWVWTGGLAVVLLAAACFYPVALNPFNRAWLKLGLLLHRVTNPIVMGLIFYGTVLPTGLIMRAAGKDLLRLKRQSDAQTYWIARQPPGPPAESLKDQF